MTVPALNLGPEDDTAPIAGAQVVPESRHVASYRYVDDDGELIFVVDRFQVAKGKTFRQRRSSPGGPWIHDLNGVRRVPYRLEEVLHRPEGAPVYIVEGEKDVETLRRAGLVATCSPGGAGKWEDEFAVPLGEADVIVIPDNDTAGRRHAEAVATSLRGIAASVKVIALPGLPEKGDVTDWLALGNSGAALQALVAAAPVWTDPDALPWPTLLADVVDEPIRWLAERLIPEGELILLAGEGGVGKSTLGLAMAGAVVAGAPVFGMFPVARPGPVLIVSEEDPAPVVRRRLLALARGQRWPVEQIEQKVHILARAGVTITDARWADHLLEVAERLDPRLIMVDPLIEVMGGADENSNSEASPVIRRLRSLGGRTRTVAVIHHAGKQREGARQADRIRGASAWHAAARLVVFADRTADDISISVIKLTHGPRPEPFVLRQTVVEDFDRPGSPHAIFLQAETREAASVNQAERFVLDQLERRPGQTTTALKSAVEGTGIKAPDLSRAIARLANMNVIAFDAGPRNAKFWRLVTSPAEGSLL